MKSEQLKAAISSLLELSDAIVERMPQHGDKAEDCQKTALRIAMQGLDHCVNGVTDEDLLPSGEYEQERVDPERVARALKQVNQFVKALNTKSVDCAPGMG